ncbi:MAG: CocE/NonD family hydrolase, partial [Mycobacteriales bacterium]
PYVEHVLGWARLKTLLYRDAGYAVIFQLLRGVGASDGEFSFNGPSDRTDGYDTVEWIAAQPWCDGHVGMDGGSYVAMTQLTAATLRPPHLRCIVPSVPSANFFAEIPYMGGVFSRLHSINWTHIISVESLTELTGGFVAAMPILSQLPWLKRMTSRPVCQAARGVLQGDKLKHFEDVLAHPTFDDWWRERTMSDADYANIQIPALVVLGNFDLCIGGLTVWRGLEAHAESDAERSLLIGPWDHGQSYVGGATQHGPYELGEHSVLDLVALRLAFFDRHLKGIGEGPSLGGRVRLFVTGVNEWRSFDRFPPLEVTEVAFYLRSGGAANSVRGDGCLASAPAAGSEAPDHFIADPTLPFVPALA